MTNTPEEVIVLLDLANKIKNIRITDFTVSVEHDDELICAIQEVAWAYIREFGEFAK